MGFRLGGSSDGFDIDNNGAVSLAAISDCAGSCGTAGQVLSSNGSNAIEWITTGGGGASQATPTTAGTVFGCSITSATATTALGYCAGFALTTGSCNTLLGYQAGDSATTLNRTVIIGSKAGCSIVGGQDAVIIGHCAGSSYTDANGSHLAIGAYAYSNGTGIGNTVVGNSAGSNGGGNSMVLMGYMAGVWGGSNNTAIGYQALMGCAADANLRNTAVGYQSLCGITTGFCNTAIGMWSGRTLTTGSNNIIIGYNAAPATATANNAITLGNSSITTIRAQVTTITSLSDARDKTDVTALPVGLDFINTLNPVKFTWQMREPNEVKDGTTEAGFIAQELLAAQEQASANYLDLVYDENPEKLEASPGKLLPVLVKAIQELSAKNDALDARIAQLEANG